jgi:hypothetical protein
MEDILAIAQENCAPRPTITDGLPEKAELTALFETWAIPRASSRRKRLVGARMLGFTH